MASGGCPRCGAPFVPGAARCAYCGSPLPDPGLLLPPPPVPTASSDPFRLAQTPVTSWRGPALGLGIGLTVLAVLLFVGAAIAQAGTQSFNQACAQNPVCTPAPDPAGAITFGGVVVLIIGLGLLAYALTRDRPYI